MMSSYREGSIHVKSMLLASHWSYKDPASLYEPQNDRVNKLYKMRIVTNVTCSSFDTVYPTMTDGSKHKEGKSCKVENQ